MNSRMSPVKAAAAVKIVNLINSLVTILQMLELFLFRVIQI